VTIRKANLISPVILKVSSHECGHTVNAISSDRTIVVQLCCNYGAIML